MFHVLNAVVGGQAIGDKKETALMVHEYFVAGSLAYSLDVYDAAAILR
jgi:hypothetical protein